MRKSTSAIHWGDKQSTHNNGSMFFIDTGGGLFAVTALHVYHGYVKAASEQPLYCQIDNLPFNPTARLVSREGKVDIATFRVTREELDRLEKLTIPWPPVMPSKGNSVFVCGFPGVARLNFSPRIVDFGVYIAEFATDNINDVSLSVMKPPSEQLVDIVGKGIPDPGFDTGGMSGGPMVIPQISQAGIVSWSLAAVVYEGHRSFDIIKGMRADLINEDGSVNEPDFL